MSLCFFCSKKSLNLHEFVKVQDCNNLEALVLMVLKGAGWFLVASSGEVTELQLAEYPFLYKRVQVPTVAVKLPKNTKSPILSQCFGLSVLAYCRNMLDSVEEDPLPM